MSKTGKELEKERTDFLKKQEKERSEKERKLKEEKEKEEKKH